MEFDLQHIPVSHEDERRKLTAIMSGDFVAKQIKLLDIKKTSVLGGHYHEYSELFYIVTGRAAFTLESVDTKEKVPVTLKPGDRLVIGPRIAHSVVMTKGTMTIEATEQPYVSPEVNDVRYEIK